MGRNNLAERDILAATKDVRGSTWNRSCTHLSSSAKKGSTICILVEGFAWITFAGGSGVYDHADGHAHGDHNGEAGSEERQVEEGAVGLGGEDCDAQRCALKELQARPP